VNLKNERLAANPKKIRENILLERIERERERVHTNCHYSFIVVFFLSFFPILLQILM
jgi:hypothetical protein